MRHKLIVFLLVFILAPSRAPAKDAGIREPLWLDGSWSYQPVARTTLEADGSIAEDKTNLPPSGKMTIPSNWHLNGLADFNGRVRFERDFDFDQPPAAGTHVFLIFHGVDYFAEVELNESPVGRHEGYFQTFEFDVTPQIKQGHNHLVVTVDAPREEPGTVWPDHKRLIKGVLSHWDCKPGSVLMKSGQDGTSAGIWNSVVLEVRRTAWLVDVKIQPFLYDRKLTPGHEKDAGVDAKVFITAEVHAAQAGHYSLTATAGGVTVTSPIDLTTTAGTVVLVLPLEQPHLWWTWDLGEPYLYVCNLALAAHSETVYRRDINFGVRSITLDEKTGDWRLNGTRFFIRGTSIVPDMWLAH